jgi:hypothetical protein
VSPQLRRVSETENLIVDFEADEIAEVQRPTALVGIFEIRKNVCEITHEHGDVSRPAVGWIYRRPKRAARHIQRREYRLCPVFCLWIEDEQTRSGVPITVTSVPSRSWSIYLCPDLSGR